MTESIADMPQTKKYYPYEPTLKSWALCSLFGVVAVVLALPGLLILDFIVGGNPGGVHGRVQGRFNIWLDSFGSVQRSLGSHL